MSRPIPKRTGLLKERDRSRLNPAERRKLEETEEGYYQALMLIFEMEVEEMLRGPLNPLDKATLKSLRETRSLARVLAGRLLLQAMAREQKPN